MGGTQVPEERKTKGKRMVSHTWGVSSGAPPFQQHRTHHSLHPKTPHTLPSAEEQITLLMGRGQDP